MNVEPLRIRKHLLTARSYHRHIQTCQRLTIGSVRLIGACGLHESNPPYIDISSQTEHDRGTYRATMLQRTWGMPRVDVEQAIAQFALPGHLHTTPDACSPLQAGAGPSKEIRPSSDPASVALQLEDAQSSSDIISELAAETSRLHAKAGQTALMALAEAHETADEGDIDDDWWYSLSPHYRDTAELEWSGWRLRVRPLLRDQPLSQRFRERLEALHRYKERWGDMNVPRRFWEDWALGIWVSDVRAASRRQWLNPTQTRCLQDMQFPFKLSGAGKDWDHQFHELRRFQEEFSCTGPGLKWRDPNADFPNNFAKWYHQLPELFAQHILSPGQVQKLHGIGMRLTKAGAATLALEDYAEEHQRVVGLDSHFHTMFAQLCLFRQMYGTTLVPRQVFDNLSLGEWVHVLRRQGKQQLLSVWKRECLERVHFVWEVDQQTALWHYHLHEARRYKLAFGHARIPEDYHNEDQPGWIGAARWTTRNARLFAKGKLGDKRYELIRNVLGIKFLKKTGGAPLWKDGDMLPYTVTVMGPWNRHHQKAT